MSPSNMSRPHSVPAYTGRREYGVDDPRGFHWLFLKKLKNTYLGRGTV